MMFFWRDNEILKLKDSEGLQLGRSYPEEMQACPAKILNLSLSLSVSVWKDKQSKDWQTHQK